MLRILTQDSILLGQDHIQVLNASGAYPTMADAARAILEVLPGRGLTETTARQVAAEMLARKLIRMDPLAREVTLNAHLDRALKGEALQPAIAERLFARGPFRDVVEVEIALMDACREVYDAAPSVSRAHALADDLVTYGAIDLTHFTPVPHVA